jgi:hypothetical protein
MISVREKRTFTPPQLRNPAPWQREQIGVIRKAFKTGEPIAVRLEEYVSHPDFAWTVDFHFIKGLAVKPSEKELMLPSLRERSFLARVTEVKRDPFRYKVDLLLPHDLKGLTAALENIGALVLGGTPWTEECLTRISLSLRENYPLGAAEILHQVWINSAAKIDTFGSVPIRSGFLVGPKDIAEIISRLTPEEQTQMIPKLRLCFTGNFASEIIRALGERS